MDRGAVRSAAVTVLVSMIVISGCVATQSETNGTTPTEMGPATPSGPAVSVENTISNDNVTYIESNDSVRYPATISSQSGAEGPPTQTVKYGTMPFAEWADAEAAMLGAQYLDDVVAEEMDVAADGIHVGAGEEDGSFRIVVDIRYKLESDGDVLSTPTVEFEDLVEKTPKRVNSTVTLDGRTFQAEYEVVVREKIQREV